MELFLINNRCHVNFHCLECNKFYSQKRDLTAHVKFYHRKETEYECLECDQRFPLEKNLTRHIKEQHTSKTRGNQNCYQRYFNSIKYGAMFSCVACHMANYLPSVDIFDKKLKTKLEQIYGEPNVFDFLLAEAY